MLKHRIDNIYEDEFTLFQNNTYITSDERLDFLSDYLTDFDLITKYDFGSREIQTSFLDSEELDYKLPRIHEIIYMNLIKNLRQYKLLYASDAEGDEIVPSSDYKITRQYGEEQKHFDYGNKSATDTFSQKQDTNVHGQQKNTEVIGSGQETTTSAPRGTTSQNSRTTFDSTTDYDTTKNILSSIQTIDTVTDATRTNTSTDDSYTDTLTQGQHNVTKTQQSHTDDVTYDQHTDNVYGYKGNPTKNIEIFRKYLSDNTVKRIVSDCINTFTYSIYLYTGQM